MAGRSRSVPSKAYDAEYYQWGFPESGPLRSELEDRTKRAMALAGITPGMDVLDIGCGPGDLVLACAAVGCRVVGIDYSPCAIGLAAGRIASSPAHIRDRVSLEVMNAKCLGYPSGRFAVVFMTDVVEHLYPEELQVALDEAVRVLNRPGKLVIRTAPNAWLVKPIYGVAKVLLRTRSWGTESYHVNELSPLTMSLSLRRAGINHRLVMGRASDDYFSSHLPTVAGPRLRSLGRTIDRVFRSSAMEAAVFRTPLKYLLGTEIWAVADFGHEAEVGRRGVPHD